MKEVKNEQGGQPDAQPEGMIPEERLKDASYHYPKGKGFLAPLILGIAALVLGLCGQTLPIIGAIIGVLALAMQRFSGVPSNQQKAPKVATTLAAGGIILSLALSFYHPQPGAIALTIDAPEWKDSYGEITVFVSGETTRGDKVNDTLEVEPNTPLTLSDYETGTYTFTVDADDLEFEEMLFEPEEDSFECQLGLECDSEIEIPLEYIPLDGELTFSLGNAIVPTETATATITVSGTTDEGDPFTDSFEMAFGETRVLSNYPRGSYVFSISPSSFTIGDTVYSISARRGTFSKRDDVSVQLSASVDTQATQELAEQRAAEKAAAEAQAAAEEAARQQEAARQEAQRQQNSSSELTGQTVYITDTGSKYHRYGCRYLRQSCHSISLSSAKSRGYTACKVCDPPQ